MTKLRDVLKQADAYQRPVIADHVSNVETVLRNHLTEMYGAKTEYFGAGVAEPDAEGSRVSLRLNSATGRNGVGWKTVDINLDKTGIVRVSSSVFSEMGSSGASWIPQKKIDLIDVSLKNVDDAVVSILNGMKQVSPEFADKMSEHIEAGSYQGRAPEIVSMTPSTF